MLTGVFQQHVIENMELVSINTIVGIHRDVTKSLAS